MCLISFAWKYDAQYPLIWLSNRDEFYNRPTQQVHFWEENQQILAGKDLAAGGTWLGVTQNGKIAALTNYRDPQNIRDEAPSRGHLVSNFLSQEVSPPEYLHQIAQTAHQYNGFNLLVGDTEQLWYFSNYQNKPQKLESGIYGLSNHLLNTDWYKVGRAKDKIKKLIDSQHFVPQLWLDQWHDTTLPSSDGQVQQTGLSMDKERMLSPMFIQSPQYGTCASSLLWIARNKRITFVERTYNTPSKRVAERQFDFQLVGQPSLA